MTIVPQLLTDVTDADSLFHCDAYAAEEKMDGDRLFVSKNGNNVWGTSRQGLPVALNERIVALAMLGGERFVIDGELMPGGEFVAFDIISHGPLSCVTWANSARFELLRSVSPFRVVERATGITDKLSLFYRVQGAKGEGIVFKQVNAMYEGGRSVNYQRLKNYETEDFVVTGIDWEHCSVFVAKDGVPRGKVQSSLGRLPKVGDVVRVKYDKVTEKGKLLRARILSDLRG